MDFQPRAEREAEASGSTYHLERSERLKGSWSTYYLELNFKTFRCVRVQNSVESCRKKIPSTVRFQALTPLGSLVQLEPFEFVFFAFFAGHFNNGFIVCLCVVKHTNNDRRHNRNNIENNDRDMKILV